jgi:hypothetical protein
MSKDQRIIIARRQRDRAHRVRAAEEKMTRT